MYENLMVEPFLFHWSFVALNFGIWHRLVGLDKIEKGRDFLIPIVLIGGPIAFFLIAMGVLIRWFIIRTGARQTFIAPSGKKAYWLYQVKFPFKWLVPTVVWSGFWCGVYCMIWLYALTHTGV